MKPEIEAKFTNVDHDDVRAKLKNIGGACHLPMRLMRRSVFHTPHLIAKDAFVRVRDEGERITLTYKQFDDVTSITGVQEIETTVEDFEATTLILESAGLSKDAYQETRREIWKVDDVEIMLDEWPWLNPFIEIEGPSENTVRAVAEKLGFDWSKKVVGGVASVYVIQYPGLGVDAAEIINRKLPVMCFEDPLPSQFE